MSFESAKNYLKRYNLDKNIIEFNKSSVTVSDAAQVLNCKEGEIAKTMAFLVGKDAILILVAGDKKIDNSKYKSVFNTKAKMISLDAVENIIGHVSGGICPFGINENIKVYLDVSLKDYSVIYPACGSRNSAVKLTIKELEESSNYIEYIDVCK